MKRTAINIRNRALPVNMQKLVLMVTLLFALGICTANTVDAQRRGGRHGMPSWHYSHLPARGEYFRSVPHASHRYFYGDRDFYFDHGLFYRPFFDQFEVVAPPFGLRIGFLPRGYLSFYIGGFPYYYYCGTYYIHKNGQYEVVAPPVGAVVESLPKGYDKVEIKGQTYYTLDGVQYEPVLKNGEIWYKVIKSPAKAPD